MDYNIIIHAYKTKTSMTSQPLKFHQMKITVCDKYISGNSEKHKKLEPRKEFLWLTQTKGELYI